MGGPQEIHPHLELAKKPTCVISQKTLGGKKFPCFLRFLYGKSNTFALSFFFGPLLRFFFVTRFSRARTTHSLLLFPPFFPPFFSDDRSWENEVGPRKKIIFPPLNVSPFRNEEERERSLLITCLTTGEKMGGAAIFFFPWKKKAVGNVGLGEDLLKSKRGA